jgi:hypothetical protein
MTTTQTAASARPKLEPLAVACTKSDCDNDLHCFKNTRKMTPYQVGQCRSCGAKLIEWDRVQRRDPDDVPFTFASLKREWIRHHMWHTPIDERAALHARRKGRAGLQEAALRRLKASVGTAQPFRDGMQTPMAGNVLYYAQHALACCCRTCVEYWHGIPKGVPLTDDQLAYFSRLIMLFVDERLPGLAEAGERIPRQRKTATAQAQAV